MQFVHPPASNDKTTLCLACSIQCAAKQIRFFQNMDITAGHTGVFLKINGTGKRGDSAPDKVNVRPMVVSFCS